MSNRFPPPPRRHQWVVSLSPHGLLVLHFQRGWLGWKQAHSHQAALPEGDDYLPSVQKVLKDCCRQWKTPAASDIYWVLAGDIMGVVPPAPSADDATEPGAGAGALLPFASGAVLTQIDHFGQGAEKSLLWIHKDWATEIARISNACKLRAVEIFARAQLFQPLCGRNKNQTSIVLEADKDDYFLHIFAPDGAILRSRLVDKATLSDGLAGLLTVELASLPSNEENAPAKRFKLFAPAAQLPSKADWSHSSQALPSTAPSALLEQLWRSGLEGIVLEATHHHLIQKINLWSMVAGGVGLAILATLLWHDGKLERQIEDTHEALRKQSPKVEAAKLLKAKTMWMADVVHAAQALEKDTETLAAFPQALAVFPPPPAALLYLRLDAKNLALAGTGDEAAVQWLHDHPVPQYQAFTDLPVPDFLAEQSISIHLQATKAPPPPSPPPEAESAAQAHPTQPEKAKP